MDINEVKADAAKASGYFEKVAALVAAHPKASIIVEVAVIVAVVVGAVIL